MCRPKMVEKVWGGQALFELYQKGDAHQKWGESWEVADLPEGQSELGRDQHFAPLHEWIEHFGKDLLGNQHPGFPLLLKIIHAADDLSIQVHPGPDDISEIENAHSKDECWYILHAHDDAFIWHGLKEAGTSRDVLQNAISDGSITDYLRRVPVSTGDVISIPPGTPHAICKNIVLLEVQEPSDTTFRLWDYNRPGLDGKPRELHQGAGIQVMQCQAQPPTIVQPVQLSGKNHSLLLQRPSFRLEKVVFSDLAQKEVLHFPANQFVLLTCACGETEVTADNTVEPLRAGQTLLVPAATSSLSLQAKERTELILSGLGPTELVKLG
ncbi:MAG: hypothetical protein CMH56_04445 [Myxococcales bacterium]|nr:hypothetical protein [Myxococcales bacterium]